MPRRIHLEPHLTNDDLEARYRASRDPVERSHWHFLWLLASGMTAAAVAGVTGYSAYWIGQIARRYNREGPDGVRDQRHDARAASRLLLAAGEQAELRAALAEPHPAGDRWCGRTVAAWIGARVGRGVRRLNAEEKIARQRLSVLQLAEALENVSAACRQRGVTRTQFYEYKRRFELQGLEGLKDLPPIHKSHPQTTPPEVVERLLALSLQHPAWGCARLSGHLKLGGISVSGPTIQGILLKHEMGTKFQRLLKLEERAAAEPIELTPEQVRAIEKANPCFRERHVESARPGELLSQDTFFVGTFKGVGKVYPHTVVDTYGSYAFGFLYTSTVPACAVAVLHNDVRPFYQERGLAVAKVLTDNGREFCGTEAHPYELYLALNDIAHKRTKVRSPQTNGLVERFRRTAKEEFFEVALRETFYDAVEALQADFDRWLTHYNAERPHLGYRNLGKRPIDTVTAYSSVRQEAS